MVQSSEQRGLRFCFQLAKMRCLQSSFCLHFRNQSQPFVCLIVCWNSCLYLSIEMKWEFPQLIYSRRHKDMVIWWSRFNEGACELLTLPSCYIGIMKFSSGAYCHLSTEQVGKKICGPKLQWVSTFLSQLLFFTLPHPIRLAVTICPLFCVSV